VAVGEDGTSDVYVFTGRVEAYRSQSANEKVAINQNQAARLDTAGLVLDPNADNDMYHFIRAIPSAPVRPQMLALDFGKVIESTIRDGNGRGTGLTDRLPGTGRALPIADPALTLNLTDTHLELIPTVCDLHDENNLDNGEFLGTQLLVYGFHRSARL